MAEPMAPFAPGASDRELLESGRRAFARGDDEAALRDLERVASAGLRFADVHYTIALIRERRDELESAAASLREAVRINPAYVEAIVALAAICERRGDFDQAESLARRAQALSRPGVDGLDATTRGRLANQQAALAEALADAGLRHEAIDHYRQALERCPTYHDIRLRLAVVLREAGLPFQSLQELERILDARPELALARVQLGLTCYAMGRLAEARRAWQRVLALEPGRRDAAMYLRLVEPMASTVEAAANADASAISSSDARAEAARAPGWSTIPLAAADGRTDAGPASAERTDPTGALDFGALFE